jgi:hypothetical protein
MYLNAGPSGGAAEAVLGASVLIWQRRLTMPSAWEDADELLVAVEIVCDGDQVRARERCKIVMSGAEKEDLEPILQILFENSDGLPDALEFDRLLLRAIRDFAAFDASKTIPVCREKLLLVFTDADHWTRVVKARPSS